MFEVIPAARVLGGITIEKVASNPKACHIPAAPRRIPVTRDFRRIRLRQDRMEDWLVGQAWRKWSHIGRNHKVEFGRANWAPENYKVYIQARSDHGVLPLMESRDESGCIDAVGG